MNREADAAVSRNRELAARLYREVFGAGRLEVADEILAATAASHGPGTTTTFGPEQIKRQAVLLRTAIPDLEAILEDQVARWDCVASRWLATGTNSGVLGLPTGSVPPTGRPIQFAEITIDRFENGRIVESWFLSDRFSLWQQLGLIPAPPTR